MTGFRATDREIRGGQPQDNGSIELGEVVAEDGSHFDITPGDVTLVKVQLRRGGQHIILCRISQPLNYIPPAGTQVMVAVPAGFSTTPGAPMIIAASGVVPENQFNDTKAKLDFGPDIDLVIKARSVTITDYDDRYITVGSDYGIKMGDAEMNGLVLKSGKWLMYVPKDGDCVGMLTLTDSSVGLVSKASGGAATISLSESNVTLTGLNFKALTNGGYLGVAATPASGIGFGPAMTTINSTSWFVAPM